MTEYVLHYWIKSPSLKSRAGGSKPFSTREVALDHGRKWIDGLLPLTSSWRLADDIEIGYRVEHRP